MLRHSPFSQANIVPVLHTVDPLLTVDPSNMQLRGAITGASPAGEHATPRLAQLPSVHLYWVPAWQLAAPDENVLPLYSQFFAEGSLPGQATPSDSQLPSSQRNCVPA